MLDSQDLQKLADILATKADVHEIRDSLSSVESTLTSLITVIDGLVSRVESLNQEYLVLRERDTRYERWFHEIAAKVGITLVP
jgi:hypothetical protein